MAQMNRQWLLRSRPMGLPTEESFEWVERPMPEPADGQVLCRTIYLSLDPYMRGRMSSMKSYAEPVAIGAVMCGGTVSQVIQSRSPLLKEGDCVLGYHGWQEFAAANAAKLTKLREGGAGVGQETDRSSQAGAPAGQAPGGVKAFPLSSYLGVLGMPGMTAYVGLLDVGQPKAGETVVVSAASGAVGSVVGQIAKIKGCRAVGIAGSDEKCRHVTGELGFDACVNYKSEPLLRALKRACPEGIDVYYDNVGGETLETVLRLINPFARIPLIGMISQYNATEMPAGPNLAPLLVKRAKIQGMIVSDHADRRDAFLADVSQWLCEGRIKYREDVVKGLENAPKAFIGLFGGKNFGKLLVQVAQE